MWTSDTYNNDGDRTGWSDSVSGGTATYGYAGQYTDAVSGLQYLRTRYYDPATSQFLTVDPLADVTGHPYAYTADNPVNLSDPTGLCQFGPVSLPIGGSENCSDDLGAAVANGRQAAGLDLLPVYEAIYRFNSTPFSNTVYNLTWVPIVTCAQNVVSCGESFGSSALQRAAAMMDMDPAYVVQQAEQVFALGKTLYYEVRCQEYGVLGAQGLVGFVLFFGPGKLGEGLAGLRGAADLADETGAAGGEGPRACGLCFPAGTLVATPHGEQAIQTLKPGDTVLAEDPKTGKVEREPVQAVIADPVSYLASVQLSDGSSITVTADHPVWGESGPGIVAPGWVEAGHLRPGDRLRVASGKDVSVTGVRFNVGRAHVYTLTVAKDHDFFVGTALVLVHNTNCPANLGDLAEVNKPDPAADKLAVRINGRARVRFANDPAQREFDAVSDQYVAQTKPADFTLNKRFRDQAKATFEYAIQTGRIPYFQFDGPPGPGVVEAIQRYDARYGVTAIVDVNPL